MTLGGCGSACSGREPQTQRGRAGRHGHLTARAEQTGARGIMRAERRAWGGGGTDMLKPGSRMLGVLAPHRSGTRCLWLGLSRPPALAPSGAADALRSTKAAAHHSVQSLRGWPDPAPEPPCDPLGPRPRTVRHNTDWTQARSVAWLRLFPARARGTQPCALRVATSTQRRLHLLAAPPLQAPPHRGRVRRSLRHRLGPAWIWLCGGGAGVWCSPSLSWAGRLLLQLAPLPPRPRTQVSPLLGFVSAPDLLPPSSVEMARWSFLWKCGSRPGKQPPSD